MLITNNFSLSNEITHVVLGGRVFIDQDGLDITSYAQAQDFALNYGFDMNLPHQRAKVVKIFKDSVTFLQNVVLEGTDLEIPTKVSKLRDPLNLLVWASAKPRNDIAKWSCAVLCIMHTLFYIDNNIFLRFLPDIQHQIFERYERYLIQEQDGGWLFKGDYEVSVLDVKRKESKNRYSLLLKLLQKSENVAETIYDHIGIRVVAEDLLDVLLLLRFFIDHNVFQAAHIKPSRTRNLMIDVKLLEEWLKMLPDSFSVKDLTPVERQTICEKLAQRIGQPAVNPYSSRDYTALQFTVNTLMRLPGSGVPALEKNRKNFKKGGNPEMSNRFHIPELIQAQEEYTFFFPHEVQIMEKADFYNSRLGPASHSEYKNRQREAVRKRLLRGILPQEVTC
ncbi:MAG: TIGR04552 family protein [Holophagales bacterium]|jgi:uncharacterized protein (TIGR04562 family)|nr:TIGR04552 family protein [Holophagales bacterium]